MNHAEVVKTARPSSRRRVVGRGAFATLLGVLVCLLLCAPGAAHAQDAKRYRDEIAQYSKRLTELRAGDAGKTMANELDQTDKWLQEALVQVGSEKFNTVQTLLRRAQVQLDYVEALVDQKAVTRAADEMETRLGDMKARAHDLKTQLDSLQAREQELQQKLSTGGR